MPNSRGSDRVYGARVDVSNRDQVAAFVSGAVQRFVKPHRLVNGHGITSSATSSRIRNLRVRRRVLSVNLEGTFLGHTRAARPGCEEDANARGNRQPHLGGRHQGRAEPAPICRIECRGIISITQTMALELGPLGIRVDAAAPG